MALFPECYYSNRLEVLFEHFKERLFADSHPLTRRLVIVPSLIMRTWLLHRLASDPAIGVAAGIEVGLIESTLNELCVVFCSGYKKTQAEEPTALELAFALEKEMVSVVKSYKDLSFEEKTIWKPMLEYLSLEKVDRLSLRVVKRMHALAVQLSSLFLEYGRVGGIVTATWNKNQYGCLGWQETLWVKMEELFYPWVYPSRKFSELMMDTVPLMDEVHVHLFGLSYLSPVHHRFLTKIGSFIPLNYYWLSPCQKFWSDTISDKEARKFSTYWQKKGVSIDQQEELENYLSSSNPLLANFGKLGREMALQIEDSDFLIFSSYMVSKAIVGKDIYEGLVDNELHYDEEPKTLTLLNAVQADMSLLRNPAESAPLELGAYDHSIQVHETPKPLREVQIIYDRLLAIIEKHSNDKEPILPEDIIIMAPDIGKYAPFVKSVFGSRESVLDCQIMDLKMPLQNAFVQAFLNLLRLPSGRWEVVSLLKLFDSEAFQSKHQISKEDLHVFRKWFNHADICWGKDGQHRNELLKRDHCFKGMVEDSWAGTWEHGLGRLLEGLALLPDEGFSGPYSPLDLVQSTQSDLLGMLLQLLGSLMEDLKPLNDRTKMSLEHWSTYLKCLLEAYFKKSSSTEDAEGYNALIQQFEAIALAGRKLEKEEFEFHSIYDSLEEALQQQQATYRESYLHAVRFCSLQPMRAIPAKVVVLLGMQEGQFPRSTEQLSLNLVQGHPQAEYYPSKVEFDRYLFLEALLSARQYFLISYVSCDSGNSGQTLPSPLLSELLAYLSKAYRVQGKDPEFYCRLQHPLLPFDARYFSEDRKLFSYSKMYYEAACAYYNAAKQKAHCFVEDFALSDDDNALWREGVCVSLKDLQAFARNPIKTYFNKTLGIYLEKESDRVLKKEEDLHLSALNTAILSRQSLATPPDDLLARAERSGLLPRGPFKEVGKSNVLDKMENLIGRLAEHGIASDDLFSIECTDKYPAANFLGNVWQLPPLQLEVAGVGIVTIKGVLETVSKQGLIYFAKDELESAVKAWPSFLVLCCLIKEHALPISPSILFVESSKPTRSINNEDPKHLLSQYLGYYFKSQHSPSPLMPDWVAPILSRAESKLQELYDTDPEDAFNPTYDDYVKWLKRSSAHADISSAIENWNSTAQTLFVDLETSWYSKKAKARAKEG